MLLPRVPHSLSAVRNSTLTATRSSCPACGASGRTATESFAPRLSPVLNFVRNATHAAEGRANGPKQGPGKRLGAKKTGEEYVIPGNIIFRQRGTQWHPGENVGIGRDHTIFATQPGFVKYYRDPQLHPKRRYIGVVLRRNDVLPPPPNAARRRRLGMIAVPRNDIDPSANADDTIIGTPEMLASAQPTTPAPGPDEVVAAAETPAPPTSSPRRRTRKPNPFLGNPSARTDPMSLTLRPNYQYREANWEIGRTAERAATSPHGAERQRVNVHKFVRKDRFAALRVRKRKAAAAAEKRGALGQRGPKGKAKGRAKKKGRR